MSDDKKMVAWGASAFALTVLTIICGYIFSRSRTEIVLFIETISCFVLFGAVVVSSIKEMTPVISVVFSIAFTTAFEAVLSSVADISVVFMALFIALIFSTISKNLRQIKWAFPIIWFVGISVGMSLSHGLGLLVWAFERQ